MITIGREYPISKGCYKPGYEHACVVVTEYRPAKQGEWVLQGLFPEGVLAERTSTTPQYICKLVHKKGYETKRTE